MEDNLYKVALNAVLELKAVDTISIDISQVSFMSDYIIICTGKSKTHVQGIANSVLESAKLNNYKLFNLAGMTQGEWVLVDLGNVIVHIMQSEMREFYKLEKLWNNGNTIYLDENTEEKKA